MSPVNVEGIVNVAIANLPGIIALLKANHAQQNPGAPPLTDAEVVQGLQQAIASSLAVDAAWKALHPINPGSQG